MTARGPDAAASYELRIGGRLDAHWSTWFDGFTLTHEDDGTSTLRGVVRDQSELHGLLNRVRDLGTTLISVTQLEATNDDSEPPLIPSNSNIAGPPEPTRRTSLTTQEATNVHHHEHDHRSGSTD